MVRWVWGWVDGRRGNRGEGASLLMVLVLVVVVMVVGRNYSEQHGWRVAMRRPT